MISETTEKRRDALACAVTAAVFFGTLFLPGIAARAGAAGIAGAGVTLRIEGILAGGLSFRVDGFRAVYAIVTSFMWLFTTIFSAEYFRHEREHLARYRFFVIVTLFATEGVMLSGDLMTSFLFFEILSFTSFTWVIHEEHAEAVRAGYTYLFIAVIGGLVLFMGLLLLYHETGTLSFGELGEALRQASGSGAGGAAATGAAGLAAGSAGSAALQGAAGGAGAAALQGAAGGAGAAALQGAAAAGGNGAAALQGAATAAAAGQADPLRIRAAGICILLGFGAKAGMFPVHIWLPKAHPVAPSPASALLSGILTKVGIYGILMTTLTALVTDAAFGVLVLVLGEITMLLGAVLALFSVNLKRTLACSSMSQIGFILTGTGMAVLLTSAGSEEGWEVAFPGIVLHMLNHSLIKLALFMCAGVVVMKLHTLALDDIRGWGRNKTPLKIAFALGALGISGVPLFNGYLSKTLLHEGIVGGIHVLRSYAPYLKAAEWVFLFSGGCTFAYMLKLFVCIFIEENADRERQARFDASTEAMNPLSTAVILGSSLLMVIFGQPAVSTRIAAFMTGHEEVLRFHAFSFENLKGSAISLLIGALLYVFFVRRVLMKDNSYVNRWPARLDLEDLIYRPVLTKYLPAFFGSLAAVFGENKVLTPLARGVRLGLGKLAELFGENRILIPLSRTVMFLAAFVGRVLSSSTDAFIVLLRKTLIRERRVRAPREDEAGFFWTLRESASEAAGTIGPNFSYALMMTCIGIILILGVLVVLTIL